MRILSRGDQPLQPVLYWKHWLSWLLLKHIAGLLHFRLLSCDFALTCNNGFRKVHFAGCCIRWVCGCFALLASRGSLSPWAVATWIPLTGRSWSPFWMELIESFFAYHSCYAASSLPAGRNVFWPFLYFSHTFFSVTRPAVSIWEKREHPEKKVCPVDLMSLHFLHRFIYDPTSQSLTNYFTVAVATTTFFVFHPSNPTER